MRQSKFIFKILPVLLAFCFFAVTIMPNAAISAATHSYSSDYDNMSNEEKQAYIEQQLKEVNEKLKTLEKQSSNEEEYINVLDEKIKYMKNQLTLAQQQMDSSQDKIASLENQYKDNESKISEIEKDITSLTEKSTKLKKQFDEAYNLYGERMKAIYISGGNYSVLEALLTSEDMSVLLTRLEMIKRVSKADKKLLQNLEAAGDKMLANQKKLQKQKESLADTQTELVKTKQTLTQTVEDLKVQQTDFAAKQKDYNSEKKLADARLEKLQSQTKTYSEFRNQDENELREINDDIARAAEEWRKKQEEATRTTTTTTKKHTTTTTTKKHTSSNDDGDDTTTTKKHTTTTTTTTKKTTSSSTKLQLTYPVPSQTKITTGYGSAGYAGHTGVDFACASGSKVVAAESGTVIISKDLKNSNGTYRSYGRYIVIAHDKKNSSGNYVYTLYAHNSSRVVSEGQHVSKGQLIAYSGSTGNSTGPHCHFEVRTPTASYDDCVNPTYYLP